MRYSLREIAFVQREGTFFFGLATAISEEGFMASTNLSDGAVAETATCQSRREALKRFGRYAAVAPTTMLLLRPRSADAHHTQWHDPPNPGGASGGGGYGD
jgi:hypothetical protein